MWVYSDKMAISAIAIATFMMVAILAFLPSIRQKNRTILKMEADNQGLLVETFKGALTLKTSQAAPQLWEEFQNRLGRVARVSFSRIKLGLFALIGSDLVVGIGRIALLWFGSTLVIQEQLSIGQLLAFDNLNLNLLLLLTTFVGLVDEFAFGQTVAEMVTEVIDTSPEIVNNGKKPWVQISENAEIIGDLVSFHYPGKSDLIEKLSFKIPGGKVTALIGQSGCGKSTLAKLIGGLYPAQSGNIRMGVYNLQDLSLDSLRQQVVLVPQDAYFWNRSILENFRLALPDATFEQIVIACQIAGADDFISQLPDKYQAGVGEGGGNLSGGQRQRLAIARAIVNDPPILILDESTSGLDPVSETQILDKLLFSRRDKTTILISHRPKVINRAEWIVLLEDGELKMQGKLEDLRSIPGEHLDFLNP